MRGCRGFPTALLSYSKCPNPNNPGQVHREHTPLPFKTLKELKTVVSQYEPTAPFTLFLFDTFSKVQFTPYDWQMLSNASLSGGDYLLWKSEFADQCHQLAECNAAHQVPIMADMLKGEGLFSNSRDQIAYPLQAYQQVSLCGTKAWKALPTTGAKTEELSSVRQGPDEPHQDFGSRLLKAINQLVSDAGAGQILAKQLAFETGNSTPDMGPQAIPTGIYGPLPPNTVGLLLSRSSWTMKGLQVFPGVIFFHGG